MKVFSLVCLLALVPAVAGAAQAHSKAAAVAPTGAARTPKSVRTIELTGGDTMKYDLASIHAHPGERLHVVLKSIGTAPKVVMAHNFVLLKAGVKPEEFVNAAMDARATDFIPAAMQDKVIAAKGLVGPGETVDVTFTAPMKPGTYTYLCSFPGHYMVGMKGELIVK
jgi:azurin